MRKLSYDSDNDIFFVHSGFKANEEFASNGVVGDIVLDISSKGRVCGVEIMNASDYLRVFGVTKDILMNLKDVDFSAERKDNSVDIELVFCTKEGQKTAKIAIMLEELPLAVLE